MQCSWNMVGEPRMEHGQFYVHDLPGRLRVRTPLLKRERSAQAAKFISAIPGVKSAQHSPVTGSLLVLYDAKTISSDRLLARIGSLAALEICPRKTNPPVRRSRPQLAPSPDSSSDIWAQMAKKAAVLVLEKAVERSVVLLLAQVF